MKPRDPWEGRRPGDAITGRGVPYELRRKIVQARLERLRFADRWFANLRFAASRKWTEWTK